MADPSLLESFPAPTATPFVIEHTAEEFTSLCPMTGQPDFGRVIVRYVPAERCVELRSFKLYLQSYRSDGIFFEAVTNAIRDHLVDLLDPAWLQLETIWSVRGGIHSRVVAEHGPVPDRWRQG